MGISGRALPGPLGEEKEEEGDGEDLAAAASGAGRDCWREVKGERGPRAGAAAVMVVAVVVVVVAVVVVVGSAGVGSFRVGGGP